MENLASPFYSEGFVKPVSTTTKKNKYTVSAKKWSIDLVQFTLHPSFGGFFRQIFGKGENLHFISLSWDLKKMNLSDNLNSIGNYLPLELNPGQSHDFEQNSLNLYPENIVQDSVNLAFFVFKSKSIKFSVNRILDKVNLKIKNSLINQELSEWSGNYSKENKEYLDYLSQTLFEDIKQVLNTADTKFVTLFDLKFDATKESEFVGVREYMEDHVRLTLKSNVD